MDLPINAFAAGLSLSLIAACIMGVWAYMLWTDGSRIPFLGVYVPPAVSAVMALSGQMILAGLEWSLAGRIAAANYTSMLVIGCAAAFYGLVMVVFVIEWIRAAIKGPRPPKPSWEFYLDEGGLCLRGAFPYTHKDPKSGQDSVKVRTFNGTAEAFLTFNEQWNSSESQRTYARAVEAKRLEFRDGRYPKRQNPYDGFRTAIGL